MDDSDRGTPSMLQPTIPRLCSKGATSDIGIHDWLLAAFTKKTS